MAAALGMPSHSEQTKMMSSSDYPDWLTAEHRTGVSKDFMILFLSVFFFYIILFVVVFQTTIMAVEFNGGVVIGADSRTTTG